MQRSNRATPRESSGVSSGSDDEVYDVVGVLPHSFSFLNPEVRLFVPLAFSDEDRAEERRYSQNHEQIARLARGVTLEQAQAQVDALNAQFVERAGPLKAPLIKAGYTTRMVRVRGRSRAQRARGAAAVAAAACVFVVLIAAVNIANLSLVRAQRPHEGACDAQRDWRRARPDRLSARRPRRRC